jgi:hypothetical protein
MLEEIVKEKPRNYKPRKSIVNPDADIFETFLLYNRVLLEWSRTKPEYNRIFKLMEIDEREFIAKLRGKTRVCSATTVGIAMGGDGNCS